MNIKKLNKATNKAIKDLKKCGINTKKFGINNKEHEIFNLVMQNAFKTIEICKLRKELDQIKKELKRIIK